MSGCAVCVYDLYEESQSHYRDSIETIRKSLSNLAIPQTEWPSSLTNTLRSDIQKVASASESAFEALEKALAAKSVALTR